MYESFKLIHFHLLRSLNEMENEKIVWWKLKQRKTRKIRILSTRNVLNQLEKIKVSDLIKKENKLPALIELLEKDSRADGEKLEELGFLIPFYKRNASFGNYHEYEYKKMKSMTESIEPYWKAQVFWLNLMKSLL